MASESPSAVPHLDSLQVRAQTALAGAGFNLVLSPVLPAAWPPVVPAIEYFAYAFMPLPSGVASSRVTGPKFKLALSLPEGQPVLSPLADGEASGTEYDRWPGSENMREAQKALLDVVAGRRMAQEAKGDLGPYLKWSRFHAVMGVDARKRKSAFFDWLESEEAAGATPR